MTTPLTDEQLAEIEARCTAATPGRWIRVANKRGRFEIRYDYERGGMGDAEFVANARDDIPALLAEVRRLKVENESLRADLELAGESIRLREGK